MAVPSTCATFEPWPKLAFDLRPPDQHMAGGGPSAKGAEMNGETANAHRSAAIIRAYGPDGDAVAEALKWTWRQAHQLGLSEVAVLVSTLDQIEHAAPHLGLDPTRLRREREVRSGGLRIRFINERDWPAGYSNPVVALWLDDEQMQKVDGMRLPAVCAVTWNRETDLKVWTAAWVPEDLRDLGGDDQYVEVSPVVRAALDDLLARVNLATGVSHPSDRAAAVQLLSILQRAGERLDPDAIDAYLRRGGMSPKGSAAVGDLAAKTARGKRLKAGSRAWRDNVLERWRGRVTD